MFVVRIRFTQGDTSLRRNVTPLSEVFGIAIGSVQKVDQTGALITGNKTTLEAGMLRITIRA